MPFSLKTNEYSVVNGVRKLIKFRPYLCMMRSNGGRVYIQEGQVYAGNGKRMNELPPWFQEEIVKQSDATLDRVGWTEHRKVGRPATKETLEKKLAAKAEKEEPTKKESKVEEPVKDA